MPPRIPRHQEGTVLLSWTARYGFDVPRWRIEDNDSDRENYERSPTSSGRSILKSRSRNFEKRHTLDRSSTGTTFTDQSLASDNDTCLSPRENFARQNLKSTGNLSVATSASSHTIHYRKQHSRVSTDSWKGQCCRASCMTLKTRFVSVGPAVVILEWDDVLCPTWFLKKYVVRDGNDSSPRLPNRFAMRAHGLALHSFLRETCKVATVIIITNCSKEWMQTSSSYFPDFDVSAVTSVLGIDIYHVEGVGKPTPKEIVDAKGVAMYDALMKFYGSVRASWNAISVSSSSVEAEALGQCMQRFSGFGPRRTKKVRVSSQQRPESMTLTLDSLSKQMADWVQSARDIDTFHFVK